MHNSLENVNENTTIGAFATGATTPSRSEKIKNALRDYTSRGWRLHPLHSIVRNGEQFECSCDSWKRRNAERDGAAFECCPAPGKAAYVKGWQKRASADPEQVARWWSKKDGGWPNANFGIATGEESGLFVFDIDGEEGKRQLDALIAKYGPLPRTPTVRTGSGGLHYYFRCPQGVELRNTANKIASKLDSRANGGYVVAPPSIHKSGREYKFMPGLSPADVELADIPGWLIELCTADCKTQDKKAQQEKKESKKSIGRAQSALPIVADAGAPSKGFEAYLALIGDDDGMQGFDNPILSAACSWFAAHDCDEDTSEELKAALLRRVEEAPKKADRTNVSRYLSDEYLNRRIAEALDFVRKNGEPFGALMEEAKGFNAGTSDSVLDNILAKLARMKVRSEQRAELVAKIVATTGREKKAVESRAKRAYLLTLAEERQYTFDDEEAGIAAMNEIASVCLIRGKAVVLIEEPDVDGTSYRLATFADAVNVFAPWKFVDGSSDKPKLVSLFPAWKASPLRRMTYGITFNPGAEVDPRFYNTWSGLKLQPPNRSIHDGKAPGSGCRRILRHLFAVVCGGNAAHFEWLMAWQADLYQQPTVKKGTALVLKSETRGTGKSTLGEIHMRILGRHAQRVTGKESLTDKFNGHLTEALLVIGEELLFANDHNAANKLKSMITENTTMIEKKTIDKIQLPNHSRFLLISNESQAVPAQTGSERRFFILEVGAQYRKTAGDDPAQDALADGYFKELYNEIENGGAEAFLEILMGFDLSRVNLRQPPRTEALASQIEANLKPPERWLHGVLETGYFVGQDGVSYEERTDDWENKSVEVPAENIYEAYNAHVSAYSQKKVDTRQIGKFLREAIPDVAITRPRGADGRDPRYVFPPLPACRAAFERHAGVRYAREDTAEAAVDWRPLIVQAERTGDWSDLDQRAIKDHALSKILHGHEGYNTWAMTDAQSDVEPESDARMEEGRLMALDAAIDMILFPECDPSP